MGDSFVGVSNSTVIHNSIIDGRFIADAVSYRSDKRYVVVGGAIDSNDFYWNGRYWTDIEENAVRYSRTHALDVVEYLESFGDVAVIQAV